MKLPPAVRLRQDDTHRLVPRRYAVDEQRPLRRLTDEGSELDALTDLERATDNRVLGESGLLPGIGLHELVFGVPYAHIVNAAFTYAHPAGGRFNGLERGAWYAAFRLETSQAEVAFHRSGELQEIRWPSSRGLRMRRIFALIFVPNFTTFAGEPNSATASRLTPTPPHNGSRRHFWSEDRRESCTPVSERRPTAIASFVSGRRWSRMFGKALR